MKKQIRNFSIKLLAMLLVLVLVAGCSDRTITDTPTTVGVEFKDAATEVTMFETTADANGLVSPFADPKGYKINGYYYNQECTEPFDFNEPLKEYTVIWLSMTPLSLAITFNTQGGSELPATDVLAGNLVSKPADPTREGYTFAGWFKEPSCIHIFDFDTDTVIVNTTLYAQWEQSGDAPPPESSSSVAPPPAVSSQAPAPPAPPASSKAPTPPASSVPSVSGSLIINPASVILSVDNSVEVTVKNNGKAVDPGDGKFTSAQPSIATVTSQGVIVGVKTGKTTVTFTHKNGMTATCAVEVKGSLAEEIEIYGDDYVVEVGKTVKLRATVYPTASADQSVTWSSSDTSIARVDANGVVTGKKEGTVTITATAKDGSKIKGSIDIEVIPKI